MKTTAQINAEIFKLSLKLAGLQKLKRKRELAPLVGKCFMSSDAISNRLYQAKSFDGHRLHVLNIIIRNDILGIQAFMSDTNTKPGKEITKKRFDKMVGAAIANFLEEVKK